jgi:hypothetical protein
MNDTVKMVLDASKCPYNNVEFIVESLIPHYKFLSMLSPKMSIFGPIMDTREVVKLLEEYVSQVQ